jgi:hypothetical protein
MGCTVPPSIWGVPVAGTGLGAVTARQDCDEARLIVGQASDQASGSVGQAGAGDQRRQILR